jgi:hypothetical protein
VQHFWDIFLAKTPLLIMLMERFILVRLVFILQIFNAFLFSIDQSFVINGNRAAQDTSIPPLTLQLKNEEQCSWLLQNVHLDHVKRTALSDSELLLPVETYRLQDEQNQALEKLFGKKVKHLKELLTKGAALSNSGQEDLKRELQTAIRKLSSDHFIEFNNNEIFEGPFSELRWEDWIHSIAFKLPWNSVHLSIPHKTKISGYFVPFAWNPFTKELYFFDTDFTFADADSNSLCHLYDLFRLIPQGRGLPTDKVDSLANCGPMALAAFLNLNTMDVIPALKTWEKRKYLGMLDAAFALKKHGLNYKNNKVTIRTQSIAEALGGHSNGLVLIRFTRPNGKEGPRPLWGHWVAYDRGFVYDMNASPVGGWMPEKIWKEKIVPLIHPLGSQDFYVRNVIIPNGKPEAITELALADALVPIVLGGERTTTVRLGDRTDLKKGKAMFVNNSLGIKIPINIENIQSMKMSPRPTPRRSPTRRCSRTATRPS